MSGARAHAEYDHTVKSKKVDIFEGKRCAPLLGKIATFVRVFGKFLNELWMKKVLYVLRIPHHTPHAVQKAIMTYTCGHVADMVAFDSCELEELRLLIRCTQDDFKKKLTYLCLKMKTAGTMTTLTFVPSAWNKSPRLFFGVKTRVVENLVQELPQFYVKFLEEASESRRQALSPAPMHASERHQHLVHNRVADDIDTPCHAHRQET